LAIDQKLWAVENGLSHRIKLSCLLYFFRRRGGAFQNNKANLNTVRTFQEKTVPVHASLHLNAWLPKHGQHFPCAGGFIFSFEYFVSGADGNFKKGILLVYRGVINPSDDSIVQVLFGSNDRHRHFAAFDCKARCTKAKQQQQRSRQSSPHNRPTISIPT